MCMVLNIDLARTLSPHEGGMQAHLLPFPLIHLARSQLAHVGCQIVETLPSYADF